MGLFTDPVLSTFLWGPLMGVVFQLLLTPPGPKTDNSLTVNQAATIYHTEVHHHYHGGSDRAGEAVLGAVPLLVLISTWVYLNHATVALLVLAALASVTFGFAASFLARGYIAGRLEGAAWIPRLLPPVVLAVLCWPVIEEVRWRAASIRERHPAPFTVAEIINNVPSPLFLYTILQAAGVVMLAYALLVALMDAVHHVALGGLSEPSQARGFRGSLLRATGRFAGWKGAAAMFVLIAAAWLLATGTVYEWIRALAGG